MFVSSKYQGVFLALKSEKKLSETLVPLPFSNRLILKNSWRGHFVSYFWHFLKITLKKDFSSKRLDRGVIELTKKVDRYAKNYQEIRHSFIEQLDLEDPGKRWLKLRRKAVRYFKNHHPLRQAVEAETTAAAFEFRSIAAKAGLSIDFKVKKKYNLPEKSWLDLENAAGMMVPIKAFRKMVKDTSLSHSEKRSALNFMKKVKKSVGDSPLEKTHQALQEIAGFLKTANTSQNKISKVFLLELNLYELGCSWLLEKDSAFTKNLRGFKTTLKTNADPENPDEEIEIKCGKFIKEGLDGTLHYEIAAQKHPHFKLTGYRLCFGQNSIASGINEARRQYRSKILPPLDLLKLAETGQFAIVSGVDKITTDYLDAVASMLAFLKAKKQFPANLTFQNLGVSSTYPKVLQSQEILTEGKWDFGKFFKLMEDASCKSASKHLYLIEQSHFDRSKEANFFRKIISQVVLGKKYKLAKLQKKCGLSKDGVLLQRGIDFEKQVTLYYKKIIKEGEKKKLFEKNEKVKLKLIKALSKYCCSGYIAPDLDRIILNSL